jgi:L-ascorbate metabolism protein UlaG (beta-lactamase superfamily)
VRPFLVLILTLAVLPGQGRAEGRIPSDCIALAQTAPDVVPVRFGLADDAVRIRYLDHASFALELADYLVITDFTGALGPDAVLPDIVTMNNAHDTHFTDTPDPAIPLVLRGWPDGGKPAAYDLDLGQMVVRNVTTDLRGPFGEGARRDGNSIFVFEVAGLCIGHLSHLHQIPTPAQYAAIGRLDVVMVPVDGAYTMRVEDMANVVRRFNARVVLPMHWFSPEGLANFLVELNPDHEIIVSDSAEITVSRADLPTKPKVVILRPALAP